ncbi:hypothetical protein [Synechococcus phage DSL-LC02]|nr:hypothetical protein [Synechococcus phage DSL-LC02]
MANPTIRFKRGTQSAFSSVGLNTGEPAFITDEHNFYIGVDGTSGNNKFFGSARYWKQETTSDGGGVNLYGSHAVGVGGTSITLAAPASVGTAVTYYFPATNGASSSVLTNDGNGNLSWGSGSNNAVFTGITTFTDTTDNTLGNENTGAVQLDGGMGIAKNLTVKQNLHVGGYSEFVGVVTFRGGTINIGDGASDDINVGGEFVSSLVPSTTNTYDLGTTSQRWRDGFYSRNVQITGDLIVDGNVTVGGGTTVTLFGEDVYIKSKDIILGYTTSITGADISNDDTANHAGVAIASTIGSPLVSFVASGINTLPDTYKQLMWFKSGTLGFSTDAFSFNYGLAVGTTTMANGVRLAVGTGVTVSDTAVSATTFYGTNFYGTNFYGSLVGIASTAHTVKTVQNSTNASFYPTFVDSDNAVATGESVYTDAGISYNPSSNTLTVGSLVFDGGGGSITGIASTAKQIETVTAGDNNASYYLTFVDSHNATAAPETVYTDAGIYYNPSSNTLTVANLTVDGSTTQVNTTTLTVEDNLIELAKVDGSAPGADVNKDVGLLLHYYDTSARLGAVYWDDSATRIVLASRVSESSGVLTVDDGYYADVLFKGLYINDTAGANEAVVSYTTIGGVTGRHLQNIIVDGGTF